MIPLKDDVPSQRTPFVTYALIALNLVVYLYQFSLSLDARGPGADAFESFIMEFGAVPCRLTGACTTVDQFPHPAATIFTAMFMHANLLHVLGNMLYLWIFGNNVEDALGHGRFVFFYFACGAAAALAQALAEPQAGIPMVGASGAISGVLGAYVLIYPRARITVIIPLGVLLYPTKISSFYVVGFWFILQLFSALMAQPGEPGVAWLAHVGGFVAGVALTPLLSHFPLFGRHYRGPWG